MSGRHRHAVNVRTDGLAAVLGPLAHDRHIRAAALVDVDSGMVLDSCGPDGAGDGHGPDVEIRGAAHAELARTALALASGPAGCEVVVAAADGSRHVVQPVADPHGDRLALAVVVDGSARVLARVQRRLRDVSAAALTAGPSMALRPNEDGWEPKRLPAPAPRLQAPPPAPVAPAGPTPLWVAADHVGHAGGAPLPAIAGIPQQADRPPLPRRTPGSAWTAPPAPSTPVDMEAAGPPARPAPGPRRPAPPSALPPGPARVDGRPDDDRLSRPRAGPA